jgi:hypothetical protein
MAAIFTEKPHPKIPPKQSIHSAINRMATMSTDPSNDDAIIIEAFEKLYTIEDKATQKAFHDVILRLKFRNDVLNRFRKAWIDANEFLRDAIMELNEREKQK